MTECSSQTDPSVCVCVCVCARVCRMWQWQWAGSSQLYVRTTCALKQSRALPHITSTPANPSLHSTTSGISLVQPAATQLIHPALTYCRWLGSRVVCFLDSGAEGRRFKSQPQRCRVTVLGKLFTPIVPLFTKQQNW